MDKKRKIMLIMSGVIILIISISLYNDYHERVIKSEKKVFVANPTEKPKSMVGANCDDGNQETLHDKYIDSNGTCVGFNPKKK